MKKIFFLLLLIPGFNALSQTKVGYFYDLNGNRIQRYYIGLRPPHEGSGNHPDSMATTTFSDQQSDAGQRALVEKYGVSVYPNPTNDVITVDLTKAATDIKSQNTRVHVIDNSGKIIETNNYSGTKLDLHLANNKPGTYYLRIIFKSDEILYYKVVKAN